MDIPEKPKASHCKSLPGKLSSMDSAGKVQSLECCVCVCGGVRVHMPVYSHEKEV